jgi:formylglycine-generating enzyme required for sulfatase activity
MKTFYSLIIFCLLSFASAAQKLEDLVADERNPFQFSVAKVDDSSLKFILPYFYVDIDKETWNSASEKFVQLLATKRLRFHWSADHNFNDGYKASLIISNEGTQPVLISNIIPFGTGSHRSRISGKPLADSSRSFLFLPGRSPVGVIVPHNNNDLNFTMVELSPHQTLYGLLKRSNDSIQNYLQWRIPYLLTPGATISFEFYADVVNDNWQAALKKCFQEKMLYEIKNFDNSLYERKDLQYIRRAYTMHLMMAWDKDYYSDSFYQMPHFLERMRILYGGDDIFTIWPTWPALGLDQRTQWKLMEDLPGGMKKQKQLADFAHSMQSRYFISYNPWDDTDEKSSLEKMSSIVHDVNADGVVLDTKAEANRSLQDAADKAKPGVVLYSEGMAVPKDMQGIISGRLHNDIYYPPLLNLNKLIKPEFAIFRVVEVARERIRREYSSALFNGYGVEINVMRPGRPQWIEEDYQYWGRCVRILRESSDNFTSKEWTPLIETLKDKIYVNKWPGEKKTVYTIFSLLPAGFHDRLFEVAVPTTDHLVDIWNHQEMEIQNAGDRQFVKVNLDAFDPKYLGTNNEGAVGAIGEFHKLLVVQTDGDIMSIRTTDSSEKKIKVWYDDPSYSNEFLEFNAPVVSFHPFQKFGRKQGKYVIQLFDKTELVDEAIVRIQPGTPLLVSETTNSTRSATARETMVKIPAGKFTMQVVNGDEFIPYPKKDFPKAMEMKSFWMDKYPVTNGQFKMFLDESNYHPSDTVNFLKHWIAGNPKPAEENFPVVNISYEDARAYASWYGKRLPTEAEWQYAAQTTDGRIWPWGNKVKQQGKKEKAISSTLTLVDYGEPDPRFCNNGDGNLYPVGKYRQGANPFGLEDLVGCVWQLTNDWYQSDTYEYIIIKGGSYYKPGGSWWYVQGGPKPLHYRQMLLRVSQGFERNATVGFRCAKGAE